MPPDATFPVEGTYCYWDGEESIENFQLIVHYKHSKGNNLFRVFEKNAILVDSKVTSCYEVENGTVYIYDLFQYASEVYGFISKEYSTLSDKSKAKILKFNGISSSIPPELENPIHMYLYPEKYYNIIAEELDISIGDLKRTRELGIAFNKEEETLNIPIINNAKCVAEQIWYVE